MNWLAHLLLSEPAAEFRIGNLLPDIVPATHLAGLPPEIRRGAACHRKIDAFTDQHAVVRRSIRRFASPFRRYGGVLTDIFYDHFLTRQWTSWSGEPLPEFLAKFYDALEAHHEILPALARTRLEPMRRENWLGSYGSFDSLRVTLQRMSRRLRRPFDLAAAVPVLEQHYEAFQADFGAFFPELQAHVASNVSLDREPKAMKQSDETKR